MQNIKMKIFTILLLGIGLRGLQAQETIAASGGDASGSGGTISYTVGQVFYSAGTGTGGSESQGVQQPFEISVLTGIEEGKSITLECSVYPNPVTEMLMLKIEGKLQAQYVVSLYDMNAIRLEHKKIIGTEISIDMKNRVPATYFLVVTGNNKEIKSFKIIKK